MKEMTEEQALRRQLIETLGWNNPRDRVPGIKVQKTNEGLFAVLNKPFLRRYEEMDQVTHLYFSKMKDQQLSVLITENRVFDKENIGKLNNDSNVMLTVLDGKKPIWNSEAEMKNHKYNESLKRVLKPLFNSMSAENSSWDPNLAKNIRKTLFEGIRIEKENANGLVYPLSKAELDFCR